MGYYANDEKETLFGIWAAVYIAISITDFKYVR